MLIAPEIQALERKNERISAVATTIIIIILLLLSFIWTAYRNRVPPIGEKNYEVLGAIDFGDYKQGSKNVNNFEKAVANPTPKPRQVVEPTPQPVQEVTDNAPQPIEHITNPAPSPVTIPDPPPTPDPVPDPVPPKVETPPVEEPPKQPTPDPVKVDKPTDTKADEKLEFDLNDGTSGSNQGNGDGVGNSGSPDVEVIDPNALYTFGTGSDGGIKGRSWLNPSALGNYNSQEEGSVTFEFTISPSGRVVYVRPVGVYTTPDLVRIGKDRIQKFRFSALPPGTSQVNQKVRYTIKFKLKG
ncbi:MAG: hypothetical protein AAF587_23960 [Bacteroidota bacterium]